MTKWEKLKWEVLTWFVIAGVIICGIEFLLILASMIWGG